jgi:putative GTP pyrophosphokinase
MSTFAPSPGEVQIANDLVTHYIQHQAIFQRIGENLTTLFTQNDKLPPLIHSVKQRVKNPEHLRDKIYRKMSECHEAQESFPITCENLFQNINDLAGVRILHLHTDQIKSIDVELRDLLDHERYSIIEGPFARTWDDEYRVFFEEIGIKTEPSQSLYTSVHYVVRPSLRTNCTAEIQVRTLAEELWGEVNHSINYPHESNSLACREGIKVLARITSSCTRLVDALYKAQSEHVNLTSSSSVQR